MMSTTPTTPTNLPCKPCNVAISSVQIKFTVPDLYHYIVLYYCPDINKSSHKSLLTFYKQTKKIRRGLPHHTLTDKSRIETPSNNSQYHDAAEGGLMLSSSSITSAKSLSMSASSDGASARTATPAPEDGGGGGGAGIDFSRRSSLG